MIGKRADEFRRDERHIAGDDRNERQPGRSQRARDAAHGARRAFKVRHHTRHQAAKRALLKVGKLAGTRSRNDQLAGNWRQRPSTRSMSGSPQNAMRALSQPMRDDNPPAWTTQERSARLTVVIRQNTSISTFKIQRTKLNTAAEITALRKALTKTKQRLCGTQQTASTKALVAYGGNVCESNTSKTFCTPRNGFEDRGAHRSPSVPKCGGILPNRNGSIPKRRTRSCGGIVPVFAAKASK